jgi:hypothetical protein
MIRTIAAATLLAATSAPAFANDAWLFPTHISACQRVLEYDPAGNRSNQFAARVNLGNKSAWLSVFTHHADVHTVAVMLAGGQNNQAPQHYSIANQPGATYRAGFNGVTEVIRCR